MILIVRFLDFLVQFDLTLLKSCNFRGLSVLWKQNLCDRTMLFLLKIKWLGQLLFKLFVDRMICENTSVANTP